MPILVNYLYQYIEKLLLRTNSYQRPVGFPRLQKVDFPIPASFLPIAQTLRVDEGLKKEVRTYSSKIG